MTGYGKAVVDLPGKQLTIEIRSLNSKSLDLGLKIPSVYREKESEVRNLLAKKLERGKVDLYISTDITGEVSAVSINKPLALHYQRELQDLLRDLKEDCPEGLLPLIIRMPEVIHTSREEIGEDEWNLTFNGIRFALEQLDEFRINEGKNLEKDLHARTGIILEKLEKIDPLSKQRIQDVRNRLLQDFRALLQSETNKDVIDQNRFEQELIYYLEKADFTEEQVRLKKHCSYFLDVLSQPDSQGRKLGFICQEMGREINTIGSKANDAGIQKLVVEMKDELEKIKEQLLNIL